MRYLLSIILCLWASCAWAFPPGFIGAVTQGAVAGGACETLSTDSYDGGGGGSSYGVGNATRYELGSRYTITSDYTICAVAINLKRVGSPAEPVVAKIYGISGSTIGDLIATSTTSYAYADISTSLTWYTFNFAGVPVTNAQEIYIILATGTLNDSSNYYAPSYTANTGKGLIGYTTSWEIAISNQWMNVRIYK